MPVLEGPEVVESLTLVQEIIVWTDVATKVVALAEEAGVVDMEEVAEVGEVRTI